MDSPPDDQDIADILRKVRTGDIVSGTITQVGRPHGAEVRLDGRLGQASADIGPLDVSWSRRSDEVIQVGRRVTAEVIDVDEERERIGLSLAATENPELWAFLKGLRPGEVLSGEVADVQRFGVFVALDDGPPHPVHPGVGFITIPELSWRHFDEASEIVEVGQRVTCSILCFDTHQGEARLSLRALQPDPFQEFADAAREGQEFHGTVTKLVPFGAFVRVVEGIEGLVPLDKLLSAPVEAPGQVVQVGDHVKVAVISVDRAARRLLLALKKG
ncbi:S1 RNA-binding domain-containing protein [Nonomuraea roseoviolacea]|uniref:Small subunit ribosomal protein S1 n=1 Tax=Nonomuraea roseoviolacea subsp. carminata TaxID=160689 RepID=A0ABT1JZE3_9ACTN|nr:S1 RNA-binding domain-containing protein [Nonomuraea roseoviolacea]MCP2347117.1 small subunit ribosomal protein S1 [Nonomuraea roseoviolacea subsp. carminata]